MQLQSSDRLLDIGCGTGIIALALSPMVRSIHAIDVSPAIVKRARANLADVANIRVDCGSITAIPVEAGTADKVLVYSVMQYLPDANSARQAFSEVARVLKPGGRALFAANPDPDRMEAYLDHFVGPDPVRRAREFETQRDCLWLDQPTMRRLAEEVGMTATTQTLHPRIRQHFYMFDLIAVKQ